VVGQSHLIKQLTEEEAKPLLESAEYATLLKGK